MRAAASCPDGSELVSKNGPAGKDGVDGRDGQDGKDGKDAEAPCTLTDNGDGTFDLSCGDVSVVLGDECENGFPGDVRYGANPTDEEAKLLTLFQATSCTWIRGDLVVKEYEGEQLPRALSRIVKVDGDAEFLDNEHLTKISLPRLTTVGGELYVALNGALETIDFPALTTIEGDLTVGGNHALVDLDGFPAVESIGLLSIYENSSLERVSNFVALESVGGIKVWWSAALESIAEFPALEAIVGFGQGVGTPYPILYVAENDVLSSVGKFGTVDFIDGHVEIMDNPELDHSGIEDLLDGIQVTGDTRICGNKNGPDC